MPFIVQCPYQPCQKYMLFEDGQRGSTQKCLLCKQPIQLDPDEEAEPAQPKPPATSKPPPPQKPPPHKQKPPQQRPAAPGEFEIRICPACDAQVRVPSHVGRVKCPRCQEVF